MIAVISSGLSGKERHDRLAKNTIQASHPAPAASTAQHSPAQHSTAQHSRSLPDYDEGFSIIGYIETPCSDQSSQTPRHCKPSSKLASPNGLYMFLARSTGLLDSMGLSRASYRPPPGPVQSRKTDCKDVQSLYVILTDS